jgi:hypothetical protein
MLTGRRANETPPPRARTEATPPSDSVGRTLRITITPGYDAMPDKDPKPEKVVAQPGPRTGPGSTAGRPRPTP